MDGPATLGVDVARHGSAETVLQIVRGGRLERTIARRGQDLMATAGDIAALIRDNAVIAENVRIDDCGVGGGVVDRLLELGLYVEGVNVGEAATDSERFFNLRSEVYWSMRERFREGAIAIPPDDAALLRELCAPRYRPDSRGRIKLEGKDETVKRLGYSPDRADALALALGALRDATIESTSRGAPDSISSTAASIRGVGFGRSLSISQRRR